MIEQDKEKRIKKITELFKQGKYPEINPDNFQISWKKPRYKIDIIDYSWKVWECKIYKWGTKEVVSEGFFNKEKIGKALLKKKINASLKRIGALNILEYLRVYYGS